MQYLFFILFLFARFSAAKEQLPFPFNKFKENPSSIEFPNFTKKDIPELLEMAKSSDVMSYCPAHLISSRRMDSCSKGVVALWTIEGIRQGKYPSLNPILYDVKNKDKKELKLLSQATNAYQKWWFSGGGKGNPLKGTTLRWY